MAAENDFLAAIGAYLGTAGLVPAAATVGVAEPGVVADLPAIVLSLAAAARPSNGLGGSIGFSRALITGTLRLDVCALLTADVAALSAAAVDALLAPAARDAVHRLLAMSLTELGTVGAPESPLAFRRRTARFGFAFESQNLPVEGGGVIQTITVHTGLTATTADRATGVIATKDKFLPDEKLGAQDR